MLYISYNLIFISEWNIIYYFAVKFVSWTVTVVMLWLFLFTIVVDKNRIIESIINKTNWYSLTVKVL